MNPKGNYIVLLISAVLVAIAIGIGYQQGIFSGQASPTPAESGLTLSQLQNATYSVAPFVFSGIMNIPDVSLSDGTYATSSVQTYPTGYQVLFGGSVTIATSTGNTGGFSAGAPLVLYGDLNSDGTGDAAVILRSDYQSTAGTDVSTSTDFALALVVSRNGMPFDVKTILLPRNIDMLAPGGQPFTVQSLQNFSLQNGTVTIQQAQSSAQTQPPAPMQFKLVNDVAVAVGGPSTSITTAGTAAATGISTASWASYVDKSEGFSLNYPADLMINSSPLKLTFPKSYYSLQNTIDTTVTVSATSSDFADCLNQPSGYDNALPTEIMVNATPVYDLSTLDDCGAGSCYDTDTYEIPSSDGACYLFTVQTHTGNPANYDYTAAQIQQIEQNNTALEQKLTNIAEQILATFQLIK